MQYTYTELDSELCGCNVLTVKLAGNHEHVITVNWTPKHAR